MMILICLMKLWKYCSHTTFNKKIRVAGFPSYSVGHHHQDPSDMQVKFGPDQLSSEKVSGTLSSLGILLTHRGLIDMVIILQIVFSNVFFFHETFLILIQILLYFVSKESNLTIHQLWFRWWLGTEHMMSHDLNRLWPSLPAYISITRGPFYQHGLT